MKNVDLYGRVRHAVLIDGMSSREAARVFGVDPRTIAKMLAFSFPPDTGAANLYDARSWMRLPGLLIRPLRQISWFQRSSDTRRNGYLNDCVMSMTLKAASRFRPCEKSNTLKKSLRS